MSSSSATLYYSFESSTEAFRSLMTSGSPSFLLSSSGIPPFEFSSSPPRLGSPSSSASGNVINSAHQFMEQHQRRLMQSSYRHFHNGGQHFASGSAAVVSPVPFTWGNNRLPLPNFPLADMQAPMQQSEEQQLAIPTTTNKRSRRNRKTVRFSLQQQVFTIPNDDVERREWLKQEDLDQQRNIDKRIASIVAQDDEYKSAIQFLMKSFKAEHYVGRQQLLDHVRILLKHPEARGLEHRIAHILKTKRIKAVHQFLKHQRDIRKEQSATPLKLRQVSLKLSRGARQLAFRLAQADRLAAKAIHDEEVGESVHR